jgi:hypothetical protein
MDVILLEVELREIMSMMNLCSILMNDSPLQFLNSFQP